MDLNFDNEKIIFSTGGVIEAAASSQVKLTSVGGSNNESLIFDFESTANTALIATDSGLTEIIVNPAITFTSKLESTEINIGTTGSGSAITSEATGRTRIAGRNGTNNEYVILNLETTADTFEIENGSCTTMDVSDFTNFKTQNITPTTGSAVRTGTTAADTLLLQAYDVDGTSYTTFATLTANNTPTMNLDSAVTHNSNKIHSTNHRVVSTSPQTAADGDIILSNCSAVGTDVALTLNLPASPVAGDTVEVWDTGGDATNHNITIGDGTDTIRGTGSQTLTVSTNYQKTMLRYIDGTVGWDYYQV